MPTILDALQSNLLTPPILFFLLGIIAALVKSNLKFPEPLYQALTLYLLVAIGYKGGAALAKADAAAVALPLLAAVALSALIPVWCFFALRRRFDAPDAASIAAHYGSVSAVTFITACNYLKSAAVPYEEYTAALLALMESPAIITGVVLMRLARRPADGAGRPAAGEPGSLGAALHEAFTGKSVVLLVGALVVGALAGERGLAATKPFFVDPFQGILALFLLDMGVIAGHRLPELRRVGVFLALFAVGAPLVNGALGVLAGVGAGLSVGGATLLGALAASASYIAAPAAMRVAIPEANPAYSLTAALAITFPFNITLGLPLYRELAATLSRHLA